MPNRSQRAVIMIRRYFPSSSELRKSFKLRSKEYLSENTLHGFRYFVDSSRPTWERIFWLVCTIASLCAALGIIVTILQRFQTNPTLTGTMVDKTNWSITLPSISICMTSDYLDLSRMSEDKTNIYQAFYDWDWEPIVNITLPKSLQISSDIFFQITPACDNLLTDCFDQGIRKDCNKIFKKILTSAGICCQSSTKEVLTENQNTSMLFTLKYDKPLNLYLLQMDEDTPTRDTPISYVLKRNMNLMVSTVRTDASEQMRFLTRSQRSCIFYDEDISYNNCVLECQKKTIRKICGCLPWFLSKNRQEQCSIDKYSCLSDNAERLRRPKCSSECYLYCSHTSYTFESIANSYVTVVTTRWPIVRYRREVRFGWLDLVVSFGGIMGLFLGYSILTTVELIYYFSLRFYCGAVVANDNDVTIKLKKIKVKQSKEKQVQPTAPTTMYYDYIE
ncbi:sodium channel protein Nach-like [Microplitis mediator]|uniref:sodium channel protein Nach-like n=1 Tax=Microplitis mediator TaxID=375433 RepID=UPI002555A57E|nr:sodium channel protein Nach-like [Microplitis mediator]